MIYMPMYTGIYLGTLISINKISCSQGSRRGRKRKGTPPQQQDSNANPSPPSDSKTTNSGQMQQQQEQSPNSNPFQRAPLAVLKKTGESFLQVSKSFRMLEGGSDRLFA